MARSDRSREPGCSWIQAIAFLTVCIVGGVLTWLLPPWDEVIGSVLPTFATLPPATDGSTSAPIPSPIAPPTISPTKTPLPFYRCGSSSNCCNGLESNCKQKVNEVMYATSHNAMSAEVNGFNGFNHLLSLEESLEKGYRALMLDVCDCGNEIKFCHAICNFGTRDPIKVFQNILDFLNKNPQEVILLIFQIGKYGTAPNNPIKLVDLESVMSKVPGFLNMLYTHPLTATAWPTLQELIDSNERIILFHHEASNCASNDCPNGFHYYFKHVVETPFDFESELDLKNHKESCALDRGKNGENDFYAINNFVTTVIPDQETARSVNRRDFLTEHFTQCEDLTGMRVNLITVDFWSVGTLPQIIQENNALLE